MTFATTSNVTGNRTISYVVNDGTANSNTSTHVVTVPNQAPVVTASAGTTTISANAGASVIDNAVTVSDFDNTTLSSGTVTISANKQTGDVLTFTNNNAGTFGNISASYDANTGVLSLSSAGSTATKAQWQAAYDAVTFATTSNVSGNRTISYVVNDGASNSTASTHVVNVPNQAPVVTASGGIPSVGNNGVTVVVDNAVTVSDFDNATLASGAVTITAGKQTGDTLAFSNTSNATFGNISASYNAATGVLTLTSQNASATKAQWQAAYDAVTFATSSATAGNRTISFVVNDGNVNSAASTKTVAVNVTPALTGSGTTTNYVQGGAAIVVDSHVVVIDPDSATEASGTITISAGRQTGDTLAFTNSSNATFGNIAASYNAGTGVLTLTSQNASATKAQWQAAFDAVTFTTTSGNAQNRTVSFVVNDGISNSATITQGVTITSPPAPAPPAPPVDTPSTVSNIINGASVSAPISSTIGSVATSGYSVTIPSGSIQSSSKSAIISSQLSSSPATLPGSNNLTLNSTLTPVPFVTSTGQAVVAEFSAGMSANLQSTLGLTNFQGLINLAPTNKGINPPFQLTLEQLTAVYNPLNVGSTTPLRYLTASEFASTNLDTNQFAIANTVTPGQSDFLLINDNNAKPLSPLAIDLSNYHGAALISGPITVTGLNKGNDVIAGGNGSTITMANGGSSIVIGQGGSTITGGVGKDFAYVPQTKSANAHVTVLSGSSLNTETLKVQLDIDNQATTTLTGVERLQFADQTLAFDTGTGTMPGEAYRLYMILNRVADKSGLGYWIHELEADPSQTGLSRVANSVLHSDEFIQKFGAVDNLSPEAFVTLLYQNILHRAPSAFDMIYWTGQEKLGLPRANMLRCFIESPEAVQSTASALANGLVYVAYPSNGVSAPTSPIQLTPVSSLVLNSSLTPIPFTMTNGTNPIAEFSTGLKANIQSIEGLTNLQGLASLSPTGSGLNPPLQMSTSLISVALNQLDSAKISALRYLTASDFTDSSKTGSTFAVANVVSADQTDMLVINNNKPLTSLAIDLSAYHGAALVSGPVTVTGLNKGNEVITGGNGATITLNDGGSSIVIGQGGSTIIGGVGKDFAYVPQSQSANAHITVLSGSSSNTETLKIQLDVDNQDSTFLTGVERLQFADQTLAFDTGAGSMPGEAYRLYMILNRVADKPGLGYWIHELEADPSQTGLSRVANSVLHSVEFTQKFGAVDDLSATSFVTLLYQNILHRAPSAADMNYWTGQESLGLPRANMLRCFIESPEAVQVTGTALANGLFYQAYHG